MSLSSKEFLLAKTKERLSNKEGALINSHEGLSTTAITILHKAKLRKAMKQTPEVPLQEVSQLSDDINSTSDIISQQVCFNSFENNDNEVFGNENTTAYHQSSDDNAEVVPSTNQIRETARVSAQRLLEVAREKSSRRKQPIVSPNSSLDVGDSKPESNLTSPLPVQDMMGQDSINLKTQNFSNVYAIQAQPTPTTLETIAINPALQQQSLPLKSHLSEPLSASLSPPVINPNNFLFQICMQPSLLQFPIHISLDNHIPLMNSDLRDSDVQSIIKDLTNWRTRDIKQRELTSFQIAVACSNQAFMPTLLDAGVLEHVIEDLHEMSGHVSKSSSSKSLEFNINIIAQLLNSGDQTGSLISIRLRHSLCDIITSLLHSDSPKLVESCLSIISILSNFPEHCDTICDSGICSVLLTRCNSSVTVEKTLFIVAKLISHQRCRSVLVHPQLLTLLLNSLGNGELISALSCYIIGIIATSNEYEILFEMRDPCSQIIDALHRYSRADIVVEYSLFALFRLCSINKLQGTIFSNRNLQNQLLIFLQGKKSSQSNIALYCLALLASACGNDFSIKLSKSLFNDIFSYVSHPSHIALSCLILSNLYHKDDRLEEDISPNRDICQSIVGVYTKISETRKITESDTAVLSSIALGVSALCKLDAKCRKYFFELKFTRKVAESVKTFVGNEPYFIPLLTCLMDLCVHIPSFFIDQSNVSEIVETRIPATLLNYLFEEKLMLLNTITAERLIYSICHLLFGCASRLDPDIIHKAYCKLIIGTLSRYSENWVIISSVFFLSSSLMEQFHSIAVSFLEIQMEKIVLDALVVNHDSSHCCATGLRVFLCLSKYSSRFLSNPEFSSLVLKILSEHIEEKYVALYALLLLSLILEVSSSVVDIVFLCEVCRQLLNQFSSDHVFIHTICDILIQVIPTMASPQINIDLFYLLHFWFADQDICRKILSLLALVICHGKKYRDAKFDNFPVLIRILRDFQHQISSKIIACDILASMCEATEDIAMKCGDLDACAAVLDLLSTAYQYQDHDLMRAASNFIACLICSHHHNQIICGTLAFDSLVLYLFSSWESNNEILIKENLLRALNGLCVCENQSQLNINKRNLTLLQESNVAKGVANCLRKFETCERIVLRGCQLLSYLCEDDTSKKKTLDEGILPVLLSMIDRYRENQLLLSYLCRTLAFLTENSRCASFCDKEIFHQDLLKMMSQHDDRIFVSCCTIFSNLLRLHVESEKHLLNLKQEYLFEHSIADQLYVMLQKYSQDVIVYCSSVSLLQLLVHGNRARSILVSDSDLLVLIVKGIEVHYCNILAVQLSCVLISVLGALARSNQIKLGQLGVCERILSLLAVYSTDPELVSSACLAIDNLSRGCDENSLKFGAKGACELITSILDSHKHSKPIMRAASGAISSLSSANSTRLGSEDICSKLVETLKSSFYQRDDVLFSSSLLAFNSLSDGNLANQLECGDLGSCELFIDVLLNWQSNIQIIAGIFQAIEGLCRYKSESLTLIPPIVTRFVVANGTHIIFRLLSEHKDSSDIFKSGCYILFYFLSCCPSELSALDHSELTHVIACGLSQHLRTSLTIEALCTLLELLFCLSLEVIRLLSTQVFVTTMADSFRIHATNRLKSQSSILAAQRICACLSTFLEHGEQQVAILLESTDFPLLICSALDEYKENPAFCRLITLVITRMLSVCQSSLSDVFRLGGLCDILVRVLEIYSVGNVEVAFNTCEALLSLTKQSEENLRACSTSGLPIIVCTSLAQYTCDPQYCVLSTRLLAILATDPINRRTLLSLPNISNLILVLIKSHFSNLDVLRSVGFAVWTLLESSINQSILGIDAWHLLQQLCCTFSSVESFDSETIYYYVNLLNRIVSQNFDLTNCIHEDLFEVLISLIYRTYTEPDVVSAVILLISSLTNQNFKNTKLFLSCGICESIAGVLKHSTNDEILSSVCTCLVSLSCSEDCAHQLVDLGVFKALFTVAFNNWNEQFVISWCNCISTNFRYHRVYSAVDISPILSILVSIIKTTMNSKVLESLCNAIIVVLTSSETPRFELENSELLNRLFNQFANNLSQKDVLKPLLQLVTLICSHFPSLIAHSSVTELRLNEIFQLHRSDAILIETSLRLFTLLCQHHLFFGAHLSESAFTDSISLILKDYVDNMVIVNLCLESVLLISEDSSKNIPVSLQHDLLQIITSFIFCDINNRDSMLSALKVVRILSEIHSSVSTQICESGIPLQVLHIFQNFYIDGKSSSSILTITACDTMTSLLRHAVIFQLYSKHGIVEKVVEAFQLNLQNSSILISVSSILIKLLHLDSNFMILYYNLGLCETLLIALKSSDNAQCVKHVVLLTTALISTNRELVVPLLLVDGKISEVFTMQLQAYKSTSSVYTVVCSCISLLCETGYSFEESSDIYAVLVDGLKYFRDSSEGVDITICSTILMLTRYSPCVADKFGILGLCSMLTDKILSLIRGGQKETAVKVLSLHEIVCNQCPTNRERAITEDILSKIRNLFDHSDILEEDSIILLCTLLGNLSCGPNINLFSGVKLSLMLLRLLEKFKRNRNVVIALCETLKTMTSGDVGLDDHALTTLSYELSEIYYGDGQALACGLSLLAFTSTRQHFHHRDIDLLKLNLDTLISQLQNTINDSKNCHQTIEGLYAIVKEFPSLVDASIEGDICHILCNAISLHITAPNLIEVACLTILILCEHSHTAIEQLRDTDIALLTVASVKHHGNRKQTLRLILEGTKTLLSDDILKQSFRSTNLAEILIALLQNESSPSSDLSLLIIESLQALCVDSLTKYSNPMIVGCIRAGACSIIFNLLQSQIADRRFCLCSTLMIQNFFAEIEGRLQMVSLPICKVLMEALLLHKEDSALCFHILSLLNDLTSYGNIIDISPLCSNDSLLLLLDVLQKHLGDRNIILTVIGDLFAIFQSKIINRSEGIEQKMMKRMLEIFHYYSTNDGEIIAQCFSKLYSLISPVTIGQIEIDEVKLLITTAKCFRDNSTIAEQVLMIATRALETDDSQAKYWIESGLCEVCVALLNLHFRSPAIGLAACRAISLFSHSNPHIIVLFGNHDAPKVLASVLQWNLSVNKSVARAAITAIHTLSKGNQKNIAAFGSCGVCEMITKFTSTVQNDLNSTELVLYTIWELSKDHNNQRRFVNSEAPRLILLAAESYALDLNVARAVSGCIWQLSINDTECQEIFNSLAASQKLEKILKVHPKHEEISKYCCGALWSLSTNNSGEPNDSSSSCRVLMDTLQEHIENPEVVSSVLATIRIMCQNSMIAVLFGANGACELIWKVLHESAGNAGTISAACNAIAGLCSDDRNKEKFFSYGIVSTLCGYIKQYMLDSELTISAYLASSILIKNRADIAQEYLECHFNELVLLTLNSYPMNPGVLRIVFKTLSELIEVIPSTAGEFGATGACEILATTLHDRILENDESSSVESLYLMHVLCTAPDNISKIVKAGSLPSIVRTARKFLSQREVMLSFSKVVQTVTSTIVQESKQHQQILATNGACEVLIEAMCPHISDSLIIHEILKALLAVCYQNLPYCECLYESNSLNAIFSALEYYSLTDLGISLSVCSLILICSTPDVNEYLGRLGICDYVVNTLQLAVQQEEVDSCETITYTVVRLVGGNSGNQIAFGRNPKTRELLVALLSGWARISLKAEESALWAICLLCKHTADAESVCLENISLFRSSGVFPVVIATLSKHAALQNTALIGCRTLASLSLSHNMENLNLLGSLGALDTIFSVLSNHNSSPEIVDIALETLSSLCISTTNVRLVASLHFHDVFSVLLERYPVSNCKFAQRLCQVIYSFATDKDLRILISRLHICEYIVQFFILFHYNEQYSDVCLQCVVRLVSIPDDCFSVILQSSLLEYMTEDYLPAILNSDIDIKEEQMLNSLRVFISLAENSSETCHRLVRLGACKIIVQILQRSATSKTILILTADLARILALNCENTLSTLNELGFLDYLLITFQKYETGDDELSSPINQALQVLMTDPNTRSDLGLKSTTNVVLRPLKAGNDPQMIEQSCFAIVRYVQKSKDIIPILVEQGLCELIASCVRKNMKLLTTLQAALSVIDVICDGQASVSSVMRTSGVCEVVANVIRRLVTLSSVPTELNGAVLKAIYHLSYDPENSAFFNLSGCCEHVTLMLSSAISTRNEQIVGLATRAIYKLCETCPANMESFGVAGVCILISTALSGLFTFEMSIEYSLMALAFLSRQNNHISTENFQNATAFYNLQIDEKVVAILQNSLISPKLCSSGSLAIQRLARDEASINRLCDLGACDLIPSILSRYSSKNKDVSINALSALDSLTQVERNVNHLMRDGTVLTVSQLINQYGGVDADVAISSSNIVVHLADVHDHLLGEFIHSGFCEGILKSCISFGENVHSYYVVSICSAINRLLKSPEAIKRFEVNQFCEILVKYISKFGAEEEVVSLVYGLLATLSSSEIISTYLLANGTHVLFLAGLRRHMKSVAIVRSITSVLTRLLNPNKQRMSYIDVLVDSGLIEILLGVARRYLENSDIIRKVCMILSVIGLSENVSDSLGHDGGCEIISGALRTFPGDPGVILYGCKAVSTLSVNGDNRATFHSLGILETLLSILKRFLHTESVVGAACSALVGLYDLSIPLDQEYETKMLDASGDLLKLMIVQMESPSVVEQLCLLFNSLARNISSQRVLGSHDICRCVTLVLQKHIQNPSIAMEVIILVSRLAYKCDENRYLFTKTNICECLLKAFKLHSTNDRVVESCCLAVTSLTHTNEHNAVALGRLGVCEMITTILSERGSNSNLVGVACQTIYPLSQIESNCDEFRRLKFPLLIVQILKQHYSSTIIKHLCSAIASYFRRNDEVEGILDSDICKLLGKALNSHMTNSDSVAAIAVAISNLASNSQGCCLRFQDCGVTDLLVVALTNYRDDSLTYLRIISSMLALSIHCKATGLSLSSSMTVFDLLVFGLRNYIAEVQIVEKTGRLLVYLAPTDASRTSAGISGTCEAIARVFENYSEDCNIISVMSLAVASLCENHQSNSDRCAKSKICLMVLRRLEQFLSNIDVTNSLLLAVKSLSNTVLNRRFFGGGDGCELIKIVLLKNIDHSEIVINCCRAIENICEGNIDNKDTFGRVGIIDILVKLLNDYKDQEGLVVAICDLMNNLIVEHKGNTDILCQEKVAEIFVSILKVHQTSSEIYVCISRIFVTLLHSNPQFMPVLLDLNLRAIVISALPFHELHAVAALYLIKLLRDMYKCMDDENTGLDPLHNECQNLTQLLKANANNMVINEDACNVIFLLSRSRGSSTSALFGSLGVCEVITKVATQALENKSIALAKMSLLAMVSLCAGNIENQARFGEDNACAIVVSILDSLGGSSNSIEMEGATLNAIAMLARSSKLKSSENLSNIKKLCHCLACESVTRCLELRFDNMPVVYSACRVIYCLAGEEECCQRFIRSNISDILVRILKSYQTFPAISQYACGAIANLGDHKFGADSLYSAGVCDPLVAAIVTNKKDVQLAIHGCVAIKNLCANDLEIRTNLGAVGGCKAIVSVMKLHLSNLTLLSSALLAIANISQSIPTHIEFFIQANLPNRILTIIEDHIKDEFICGCVFRVLSIFSAQPFAKEPIRNTGILDLIPKALTFHLSSSEVVAGYCQSVTQLLKVDENTSIDYYCADVCDLLISTIEVFHDDSLQLQNIFECLLTLSNAREECKTRFALLISRLPSHSFNLEVTTPEEAMLTCNTIRFYSLNAQTRCEIGKFGSEILSEIFSTFINRQEVILLAVLAVRSLAEECLDNQIILGEAGICTQLTTSMSLYSSSEISYCIALAILSMITHNSANLRVMDQPEFCISLCSYMQTSYSHSNDCQCICKLVVLLCQSPDCKTRLGKYHMCDYLTLAISIYLPQPSLLVFCLDACIALASENKENIVSLGSNEMCKYLLSIAHTHGNLLEVMKPWLQLCSIISTNHSVRVRLGDIGICESIVVICRKHYTNSDVLTASLSTIRTLASNVPQNKKLLGDVGCCELLVEFLKFGYCDRTQIEIACGAIANLCNESPDGQNVFKFDKAGVVTALVDIFQCHIGSASIMKQACSAVRHMTSSPLAPQKKFGELEICDKVVNALAMHIEEPGVNLVICSCLRGLAQDADNKILLGASGACSIVTKVLQVSVEAGDIKLTEEALLSIASLVQGSCSNQDTAGKAGACEAISELIGADNGVGIDEKALWCVTYLCRSGFDSNTTNDKNILSFTSNGVLESIFHDFELYPNNQNFIIAASWALRNLCFLQSNANQVLNSQRFEILLKILSAHLTNSSICEAVCFALSSVLVAETKAPLGQTGICELLPQVIQRHLNVPSIMDRCCSCIANLASQSAEYRHRLSVVNVCSLIVRILKLHKERSQVVEEACGVVWNMCIDSPENRLKFGIEGTCELIVEVMLLHESDLYVKEAAIGAIKSLAVANAENLRRIEACGVKIEGDGLLIYPNMISQYHSHQSHDSLRE